MADSITFALTMMVKVTQEEKTIANKEPELKVIFTEFGPRRMGLKKRRHLG